MQALYVFWDYFFSICLLRRNPQDLPASKLLLQVTFFGYALSAGLLFLDRLQWGAAVAAGLTETSLLAALTLLVLWVNDHPARATQTISALLGTGILLNLFSMPLFFWLHYLDAQNINGGFPALLILALSFWSFAISAHIFRHALSSGFGIGLGISFIISIIISVTLYQFFPLSVALD